jgi:hypothetical protein
MIRPWLFLMNPILIVTENSNVLGIRISNFHDGALYNNTGNPFIAGLYATYHPIHQTYNTAFSTNKSKIGLQIGATNAFGLLINQLGNEKINAYDASIAVVYAKGTPQYIALLPNGHYPFQQGTQEERIAALATLSISIGSDAALETVQEAIDAFVLLLKAADTAQKSAFNAVVLAGNALEAARIAMANEQYANLGAMMKQFKTKPSLAAGYFDLVSIRKGKQIFYQKSAKKNSNKFIVQRTLLPDAEVELSNIGDTVLRFYLSDRKTGAIGTVFIELAPDEVKTVSASELGDVTLLHFLMVFNQDMVTTGNFTVEFL